jgi:predicted peptidase
MLTTILIAVLSVTQPTGVLPDGSPDLFKAYEYRYTGGRYKQALFRYRLFEPRSMKPSDRYPLLVWLHGCGRLGSDNWRSLKYTELMLDDVAHIEKYRFYILAVQCPPDNRAWFSGGNAADDMLTVTAEILQKTLRERPIDQDRVYLLGVSGGGSGCWEMAARYPELFAAVVPMASGGGDTSRASKLKNIPIWAFHSRYDRDTPLIGVEMMVAAVKQAGGNIYLTASTTETHDCWTEAFGYWQVVSWLLAQRRGAPLTYPPGCSPWEWRDILPVPCCFLTIVWLARWAEGRRRSRQRLSSILTSLSVEKQ